MEWKTLNDESRKRWDQNAAHWDARMGETNNRFHNELVRPATEALLDVKQGERVLDIACGNGNFSRRLCALGAKVIAFDYSAELIKHARNRSGESDITYHVLDATDEQALLEFGPGTFDAAVANMALMDMAEITPLGRALSQLIVPGGRFVFSIMHPCFQPPGLVKVTETEDVEGRATVRHMVKLSRYITPELYEGQALSDQPVHQFYFHRPLDSVMSAFFRFQFVLDGVKEPTFAKTASARWEWGDIPPAIVFRFRKM